MSEPWYDTEEGIKKALKDGLKGLHRLSDERGAAGYTRKERMTCWIVLSYFVFDECGNTMVITEGRPDYHTFDAYPDSVFPREKMKEAKSNKPMSWTMGRIPDPDGVCPQCLEGWDTKNCHDYYQSHYATDKRPYHETCHKLKQGQAELDFFKELLDEAIHYKSIRPIPNGYRGASSGRPWFIVETISGPIKIGWRKRVISISWDKADGLKDQTTGKVFPGEDVTKESHMIHAWGKDTAVKYLKRLIPVLDQLASVTLE